MQENTPVWPGDVTKGEIEVIHEEVAWANPVARLLTAHVRFPSRENGRYVEGPQFRLDHGEGKDDGVIVAPITRDDRILLVRQFRHPVRMWMRELPRGGRDRGEAPAEAARRELHEEVGCEALEVYPLGRVATDSGQLASRPYVFAARVREGAPSRPERTEAIDRVLAYSFGELRRACQAGEIIDAFTLAAVLRLEPHFAGDRFAFRPEHAPRAGAALSEAPQDRRA